MSKSNVSNALKIAKAKVSKHSPEILIAVGITGMFTSIGLAVKSTPKALSLIAKAEEEKGEQLTKVEVVKETWKCYVPTALTAATSAACIIGANSVNSRRNAALAAAYKLSETAFNEYREKVVETIGEKKEKQVKEKIAKSKVEKNPVTKTEVIMTEKGNTLCYDAAVGRYFKSDIEKIKKAINSINRTMTYDMYVSLNDFYDELGLPHIDLGEDLGWNLDSGLVDVDFSTQMADDGTPCIVISYNIAPRYDYTKLL